MFSDRSVVLVKSGACLFLAVCVVLLVVRTMHWSLVNDASLMHYMSFLMDNGKVPYRDFGDMNMPGSLLADWLTVHAIGGGALAWRIFDLALMAIGGVSICVIARPFGWFAGLFGACLLILYHGRDGMAQLGQRDLQMTVLLLVAYTCLFHALRTGLIRSMFLFGVAAGAASTMKPTILPFAAVLLGMAVFAMYRRGQSAMPRLAAAIAGLFLPLLLVGLWLWRLHTLPEFWHSMRSVTPYYVSLGRHGALYLFKASMSPSMIVLALIAAIISWRLRDWQTAEGAALLAGVVFGLLNFVLQGKGYVYHRYPMLGLFAVWVAIECCRALSGRVKLRLLGLTGVVFGCFVVAPLCVRTALHQQWSEALLTSLQGDLTKLGGAELSGRVQCIDSISGCGTTLYRMRLAQSTALLSDFLIFGPEDRGIVRESQANFARDIKTNPPKVIVVTSWLHLSNIGDYGKLKLWPDFEEYLSTNYEVYNERSFPPLMTGQQGYRIYVLKGSSVASP